VNPVDDQKPETAVSAAPEGPRRRWVEKWPVLTPLLLVGGLVWLTQWFQERQEFIEAFPDVKFHPPALLEWFDFSDSTLKFIGDPVTLAVGGESLDHAAPFLQQFRKAERLHCWEMSEAQVQQLPALSAVETCRFRRCSLSDASCDVIAQWTTLLSLEILNNAEQSPGYHVRITTEGIRQLTTLSKLRKLTLYCTDLDADVLGVIGEFSALEQLRVGRVPVSRNGLQQLARAPKLQHVRLRACEFNTSTLDGLAKCDKLVSLDLGGSTVTDEMILSLSECPSLEHLDLTGTLVSRSGCRALLELRSDLYIEDAHGMPVAADVLDD